MSDEAKKELTVREVRIPITKKQHGLVSDLQRAVQHLDQQAMMAIHAIIAGHDQEFEQATFRGLAVEDGVYSLVVQVTEASK